MITVNDVIEKSKPHPSGVGGRQTKITNGEIEASIVGGSRGLYGDFVDSFEVAFFHAETNTFITNYLFPEVKDEVMSYINSRELEDILNHVFRNNFRFL